MSVLQKQPRPNRYKVKDGQKECTLCHVWLNAEENFRPLKGTTLDGRPQYHSWCFPCETEYYRKRHLANKYGMTADDYTYAVLEQGGRCYLCQDESNLMVDHDHQTGDVRKLLCSQCNTGLGFFKDNSDVLRRAADYIEDHNG